jgi:hypothetical protein
MTCYFLSVASLFLAMKELIAEVLESVVDIVVFCTSASFPREWNQYIDCHLLGVLVGPEAWQDPLWIASAIDSNNRVLQLLCLSVAKTGSISNPNAAHGSESPAVSVKVVMRNFAMPDWQPSGRSS